MNKLYYHDTGFDSTEILIMTKDEADRYNPCCNLYGPFKTFSECKKDAIEYHRSTIETAKWAIKDLNQKRKGRKV